MIPLKLRILPENQRKIIERKVIFAVPDSQNLASISNSTIAKLLEVDSELAVQEGELLSQLEFVQEKRRSLKTVLCLFAGAGTPTIVPTAESAQATSTETGKEPKPSGENLAVLPMKTSKESATAEVETELLPDAQLKAVKKKAPASTKRNKTTKLTPATKTAKRTSAWQEYVREEFSNISLPEVVALVLKRQADAVLEIPTIVNAIFVDEIPKEIGSQARRQVSNILSNGAMKNKWYRSQLGSYSMSRAAAKATSSSNNDA